MAPRRPPRPPEPHPPPLPPLDLPAQFRAIEPDIRAAIDRVLASQQFIQGPEGAALEREVAAFSGAAHAVAVSSGTDAILACLMSLGIGPGDEVVTTPYTFVSTVTSIARLGARAVFVDIDAHTYAIDAARLASALTPRTRAILPVHLFGQMADLAAIHACAEAYRLPVIEDAAQAIGASRSGLRVGEGSRAATLSFFPSKNLGAMGDGGMVLTGDEAFAARLRRLRNHGQEPKYTCAEVGGNFRLDELQAAILRAKLPHLGGWTEARRRHAATYRAAFGSRGLPASTLSLPFEAPDARHVYNQFVVRTPHRDGLREHLASLGIGTAVYYPVPMHLQPAFAHWGHRPGDFPEAERAARETLALPLYPELEPGSIERVVDAVATHLDRVAR